MPVDDPSTGAPPFSPPYVLGGQLVVALGVLAKPLGVPDHPSLTGYRPMTLGGRPFAVVVASAFDDPPTEMPIRYREVIVAVVLRRGTHVVSVPLTMLLDEELPVLFGHRYYGLPKTLDPSLVLRADDAGVKAHGADLVLEAHARGLLAQLALAPARWIFSLGVRLFTSRVEIVGFDPPPARGVIVALRPRAAGRALRVERATLPQGELLTLFAQSFAESRTWLGPPRAWPVGTHDAAASSPPDPTRGP